MSDEQNVQDAKLPEPAKAPIPADANVTPVPVPESLPKVLVEVPTIHDKPSGTVIAPGITVA